MAEKPDLYYARRPFDYTDDIRLDQGQVTRLVGVVNDEPLVRLGYLGKRSDLHDLPTPLPRCGRCGADFVAERFRDMHGDKRHRPRQTGLDASPAGAGVAYADESDDAEERRLEQEAPLYWDKTQASQR